MTTNTAVGKTAISAGKAENPASSRPLRRKGMSADGAYRLSRVQAEGWNAAHRVPSTAIDGFDASKIEAMNPYASDPERTRWAAGFTSALKS